MFKPIKKPKTKVDKWEDFDIIETTPNILTCMGSTYYLGNDFFPKRTFMILFKSK